MTTQKRAFLLFSGLYLLSFAVFASWFVLLLIGLIWPDTMAFANRIGLPVVVGSVVCLEVFKRLARRAERRLV
jgi:hypothetical protein